MRFNYNEELTDNPWLDRRVAYAFHLAMDRDAIIDHLYQGHGTLSGVRQVPADDAWWGILEDELRELPGFRPSNDEDIARARELLEAAGFAPGSEFRMMLSDEFELAHPGSAQLYKRMFGSALALDFTVDIQPQQVIDELLQAGVFPGLLPMLAPPATGDPTSAWINELISGAPGNLEHYHFPPVESLVKEMQTQLDMEYRSEVAREVSWILLGQDERYGLDGFAPWSVACYGEQPVIHQPWLKLPELAAAPLTHQSGYWRAEAWIDHSHPDVPKRSRV